MNVLKLLFSLCLVFQSVFAVVPTARAATSGVVIGQILAGGVNAATQEFITLYNNGPTAVDITGWCLKNKSDAAVACVAAPANVKVYVPSHQAAKIASAAYADAHPTMIGWNDRYDSIYAPTSQSSGSIVGSGDTIKLYDAGGVVVDAVSWSTSLAAGSIWQRKSNPDDTLRDTDASDITQDFDKLSQFTVALSGTYEVETQVDVCPNLDGTQSTVPDGYLADESNRCIVDQCQNVAGLQAAVPEFYDQSGRNCYEHDECPTMAGAQHAVPAGYILQDGDCRLNMAPLQVTELLPNAAGSDTGHEFIELYNPTDRQVDLAPYVIRTGTSGDKTYNFPAGASIGPGQYAVFYDSDLKFSLLNTLGRVALGAIDGRTLQQTDQYDAPGDDMAWALIGGSWQYTDQPTPGAANQASRPEETSPGSGNTVLAPCPAGKYRHPLTNRCRNADTDAAVLSSCDADQYRSPETGRCRKITTAAAVAPCKDGQYRSEETNRCRNIATASALQPCAEGQERNPETHRCRNVTAASVPPAAYAVQPVKDSVQAFIGWWVVGAIGVLALGYAGWEWRREVFGWARKWWPGQRIKK